MHETYQTEQLRALCMPLVITK